ncbi:MAG TPA: PEFG-CTERM sorting domain-containing protein [Nitrosopumilaceae archaeon]|nr:PEFG-CTERM sorting domain-containing protein [Nitrosopumilaceae archaeon]
MSKLSKLLIITTVLILYVPVNSIAQIDSEISASTDKESYKPSERVTITGTDNGNEVIPVTILVRNPIQNVYNVGQVNLQSGIFVHSFVLSDNSKPGIYTIDVKHDSHHVKLQFIVTVGLVQNIPVDGSAIKVRGGELGLIKYKNAVVSTSDNSITIELDVTSTSNEPIMQEFEIPKEVIDAPESLIIEVDGEILQCSETETNSARILNCFIPTDARTLKITGTSVIPEFGPIAILVLIIGIIGIIFVSTKIRSRHGFY